MALKTCKVTIPDIDGIEHSAQVIAETLYEAVARGLSTIRKQEWTGELCEATVRGRVQEPGSEQVVKLSEFNKWVAREGGVPREITNRNRVREILRA